PGGQGRGGIAGRRVRHDRRRKACRSDRTWLTFAVWQPFTIADALRFWGIPVPQAPQLLGRAQLTDAVLSWPRILAYLVLAGACLFMFARIDRGLGRLSRKSAGAHPQRPFDVIAGTSAVRRTTEVAQK